MIITKIHLWSNEFRIQFGCQLSKVSVFEVILVHIFPHSDTERYGLSLVFSPNVENVYQNNSEYGHFLRSV